MLTRHGVATIGSADADALPGPSPGARAAHCLNTSLHTARPTSAAIGTP